MSTMPELGAMSLKKISASRLGSALPVLLALAAIWIYFGLTEPAFLSPRNFYYLFMQSSVVGTLAVGITIVLLIGDIDLSVAATSGVCAAILAVLTTNLGISAPISCLAALSAGVCVGIFQGAMSALVGIPSFVVTLAGLLGFQGLMLKILGIHGAINVRDPFVRGITTTTLPTELGWAAAALCIAAFSWIVWYNRQKRRRLSLENNPWASDLTKVGFFV
ncbi:MAG: ABC transporter permease, partial [SAR324 cluster bacterium]|nr:ABC transporter permease [SAR324 cluster bacterium]